MPEPLPADWVAVSTRLHRCATALTRSSQDAEDLTQQTIATLLARRPDKVAHLGYARSTMLRLWLDQRRSWRREAARLARVALHRAPWHADRDALDDAELAQRLREAAATLPPRQRAVLVLRLVEDLNYAEIAEALGCSVETVRSNLHLARARMRQHLEGRS